MLSCQAEASSHPVCFTDFLVHKSLFAKGFWLVAAETANVFCALAIQNFTNQNVVSTPNLEWRKWGQHNVHEAVERKHMSFLDAKTSWVEPART